MKILALISNFERKDMFTKLITELNSNNIDTYIIDDNSSYTHDKFDVINPYNYNKKEYYKTFNNLFQYCKSNIYDVYIFLPNDFINIDFKRIENYVKNFKDSPYIFNIINDGREMSWNNKPIEKINPDYSRVYFTDCGFFTNYETLRLLDFKINKINPERFKRNPNISSGVGAQLTDRVNKLNIPIYLPTKSIAYHGNHESLMNKEERIKNPLISK